MSILMLAAVVACLVPTFGTRDDDVRHLVNINLDFGLKLYKQLARYDMHNICFSPYTVLSSLALVHAGSKGKTRAQIEHSLGFYGSFGERVDDAVGALNDVISEGLMNPVLAVYSQSGFAYNHTFVNTAQAQYGTTPQMVDFSKTQTALDRMNTFFADRTNGTISHLVNGGELRSTWRKSSVHMLLLSALSARTAWAVPAAKTHEVRRSFYLDIDLPVKVDYVTAPDKFRYGRVDNITYIEVPLLGGKQSMFIVMPDDIRGLAALEARLDAKQLHNVNATMTSRTIDVHLPRFRVAQNLGLREVVTELGITRMFTIGSAELDGVGDNRDMFVNQVVHETVLAMNRPEVYTTPKDDVIGYDTHADIQTVKIDRPFFYVISDRETGLALFLGRISHPTTKIKINFGASRSSSSNLMRFSSSLVSLLLLLRLG